MSVGKSLNGRSPLTVPTEARLKAGGWDYDYSSFYYSSSDDVFAILEPYEDWYDRAQLQGYYLYAQPMSCRPTTRVDLIEKLGQRHVNLLNLSSYNYL